MKFSEMQYERPDLQAMKDRIRELTQQLEAAGDYGEAREAFLAYDRDHRRTETMSTLAHIRHTIDTRDEFYKEEKRFWNNAFPELNEYSTAFKKALLHSPYRADFEAEYGKVFFLNAELEEKAFSPEIIEDLQKENELSQEYQSVIAQAMVSFEGKSYTIPQMTLFKSDTDDARRNAAWIAEGRWFKEHQDILDDLYDRLVHLRHDMAVKLGFENYVPMGYCRMYRNCYTKEDIEAFRKAVVDHVVPLAEEIYKAQAERNGMQYPLSFADKELMFRDGNPTPKGSADDILAAGTKFYDALSEETSAFWRTMMDGELLDVLSKEGKRSGGYMTELPDFHVPFIFANFNGTEGDVDVVTHEAGHAFAGYLNMERVPYDTILPSMEGAEVHSMSMEFFAEKYAEDFFHEDADKYRFSHLASSLTFIPYGTMVDHFQHIVYENPDFTPAERHAEWKRLLGIYMPWMRLDGEIPFYADGEGWQRQQHIYSMPFYYIDYCLAQTVALTFWGRIQDDEQDAWEHYMAYTRLGGSLPFTELLKEADLESPFEPETLKGICERAATWLKNFTL